MRSRRLRLLLAVLVLGSVAGATLARSNEEEVAAVSPPLREHQYMADGTSLHAVESGDPALPAVLFVHGSPGDWKAWETYLRDPVLQQQAHLVAPDRPGFGKSARGVAEPSMAAQARRVMAALDDNQSRAGVVVVGHSLGGPVAARIAMDYPERVVGVLLLAPSVAPALEIPRWYNRLAARPWLAALLPRDMRTSNDEIMPLRAELEEMQPRWSEIQARVHIVHGTKDRLVPVENVAFVAEMVPAERLVVERLEGEGHLIPWTDPAAVYRHLRALQALQVP